MYDNLIIAEENNVYIRLMTIRDTENILKWRNSPFVVNNFLFRETLTEEMHEDWIRTKINEGKVVQFIIGDKSSETEVGSVYFKDIDEKCESCEFGIYMDEAASGKGIGRVASMLAINYMFDEFDFDFINLRVLEKNEHAIHLYEKCGFKNTGESEMVQIDENTRENVLFMRLDKLDFKER